MSVDATSVSDAIYSAPGKMMVSGEYAVLRGAVSLVVAAQRRATVRFVEADGPDVAKSLAHETPRFPEVAAVQELAAERLGVDPGLLPVDVSALRSESDIKLGLGSSAAAAAAAAVAMFARAGRDVTDLELRDEMFRLAFDGHRVVAPRGSGADVAASLYGGLVAFRRPGGVDDPTVQACCVEWPEGLALRVVWTGQAASTRELVAKIERLEQSEPKRFATIFGNLVEEADHFSEAGTAHAFVDAAARYHAAMKALGDAASAPIVDYRLERVAGLAAAFGGSAKPSGAGGGDVALAFFAPEDDLEGFEAAVAAEESLTMLDVPLGGDGARRD